MVVEIRGKNLQDAAIALIKRGCVFIQDFKPKIFNPPEPNAALIDSIEVIVRK
jgi:hypothetical protein